MSKAATAAKAGLDETPRWQASRALLERALATIPVGSQTFFKSYLQLRLTTRRCLPKMQKAHTSSTWMATTMSISLWVWVVLVSDYRIRTASCASAFRS